MLPHFLPALFLIRLLHPLPLGQNIIYLHLTGNLPLHSRTLRQYHADLSVRLLQKHIRQFPGELSLLLHRFLPHLIHNCHGSIFRCRRNSFRTAGRLFCPSLPLLLRSVRPFCGSIGTRISRILSHSVLPIVTGPIGKCGRLSRTGLLRVLEYSPLPNCGQSRFLYLPGFPEKDFRPFHLRIVRKSFLTGIAAIDARFLRAKHFLQPRCQLLLEIDGIVLAHIHGLDLNIHLFRRSFSACILSFPCIFRYIAVLPEGRHRFLPAFVKILSVIILCVRLFRVLFRRFFHIFVITVVISFLLGERQRLMEHFQFHRLYHIFALSKPQDQFIALLHTTSSQPYPVIKVCQLIGPFFPVVSLL